MTIPSNVSNLSPEEQENLREQIGKVVQEISHFFEQEHIEELSRETEFVERESKLTGLLFLSIFVFGVNEYGNPTLEQLIGLLNNYIKEFTLSRQGLHKRINEQAVAFFEQILNLAIENTIPECLKIKMPEQFNCIYIWDSTSFQLPPALANFFAGKGGSASEAGVKIQFCYDLKHHQWCYVLQSSTEADSAMQDAIIGHTQSGDLVVFDLGYFNVGVFAAIHDKGAYYLSRFKHGVNIYLRDATGAFRAVDLTTLVQHTQFGERLELEVYIRSKHNVFTPTRLVIERLPEQAVNQRLRKLHKDASSRGRQLSAEAIFLASFNFYITNASSDLLPASCCRFLYSIRWQVELVFKAWKSHLQLHKVQVKHRPERVRTTIFAKLIFITLTVKMIGMGRDFLWFTSHREISYFRALRHFQSIAELWFSHVICLAYHEIFILLQDAISFIQRCCFKIPQHDRIYPLERLQLFGDLIVMS